MSRKRPVRESQTSSDRSGRAGQPRLPDRRIQLAILAIAAALAAILLADALFVPIEILTPHGDRAPLSPLYAIWWPVLSAWLLPAAVIGALIALGARWLPRRPSPAIPACAGLLLVLFAIGVAMVRGGPPALTAPFVIYAGEDYTADLPLALAGPDRFLEHFVELMPRLSLHGRTHPPGFTLFLVAVVRLAGPSPLVRALVVIILGGLAVFPLHALTRRRYGDEAARWAALLYAAVPAIVLFTATSLDALLPLPALAAIDCADRARAGRPGWALAAGALTALVTFLSFSGLALILVGWAVILGGVPCASTSRLNGGTDRTIDVRRGLIAGGLLLLGFLLPYVVLRIATGFDLLACFARGRANLAFIEEQLKGRGAHPVRDYLYTSTGNLIAFAIGLGATIVALIGAALRRLRRGVTGHRRANDLDGLLLGTLATLLLMALSFVYLLEVERIWLFLIGPLVAIAGHEIALRRSTDGIVARWLALLAGQTLIMEVVLYTFW